MSKLLFRAVLLTLTFGAAARLEQLALKGVVTPSTVIMKDGRPVTFAIHGFIEFKSLSEAFVYIGSQRERWKGKISAQEFRELEEHLLREAIESRVVSMVDERPLETLLTHTSEDVRQEIARVKEATPEGYAETFLTVQAKWQHALNCWSASPLIAGRVLSNWYPIEEGIQLHGATYDSTEHFWQAVKYHPAITVGELKELIAQLEKEDWKPWLARLAENPKIYLPNAYAVEFLRHNLDTERLNWFRSQLSEHGLKDGDGAREAQQRGRVAFRFSPFEEKVLWGDLADVLHLVYVLSDPEDPARQQLAEKHFDGIYLDGQKMAFLSEEFRSQMLEIWKVKFLEMRRFREVIAAIPPDTRLEHFLNDGDSPDIPIPVYVEYLNQVRELARAAAAKR